MTWPDQRITELFGIEHPILLAPMAGPCSTDLAIAVADAGGLGALPCAMLSPEQIRADIATIRARTKRPLNVNFFVHRMPDADPAADQRWKSRLAGYYAELGIDPDAPVKALSRAPFDDVACAIVEELKPEVVSFHFGLPEPSLLARVDATGAKIIGSATTAAEARWLAERGCAAIIAQGAEAGGHRGMFLTSDVSTQVGTFALVPQIVDAVTVPVIAAGRHFRWARHSCCIRAGCGRRADRHGLSLLSRSEGERAASRSAQVVSRRRHGDDQSFHRTSGARHRQQADARSGPDEPGCSAIPDRDSRVSLRSGPRRRRRGRPILRRCGPARPRRFLSRCRRLS